MGIKKTSVLMLALTAGCYGGLEGSDNAPDELSLDGEDQTEQIIENLHLAGFPDEEIEVLEDGTVFVGSDAVVNLRASIEMVKGLDEDGEFRQYRTNNLVASSVQTICINPSNTFNNNANLSDGLDMAIARYNAENLSFVMQRGGGGCDANISANVDNSGGGSAGFPSGGLPYNNFNIGQVVGTYGVDVASHVIAHELGHCVGFRHTDYFNRSISCGSGGNEGSAGVGAVHIPGTPTGATAGGSVMNSCFSLSSDGVWTAGDVTALQYLYPDNGGGDGGGGDGGGGDGGGGDGGGGDGGDPPPICTGCDIYTGTLNGTGDVDYQPNGTYYYAPAGTHSGVLDGTGNDFDLYLWRWNGYGWQTVANSLSPDSTEEINYNGSAGYYVWRVYSYNGSGDYELGLDTP